MTDQPAPDFEEARVCAEAMLMVADEPTARFGHEAVMDLSRAVLALLSEREAREELLEQRRRLLILGNYGYDTQAMVDRIDEPGFLGDEWLKEWYGEDVLDLFALPATESAQAEGERDG